MSPIYNQGQISLDRLPLFTSIHPFFSPQISLDCLPLFTSIHPFLALLPIMRRNRNSKLLSQTRTPLPTHCLHVALNSGICAGIMLINIENGERSKSLVIRLSGLTLSALIVWAKCKKKKKKKKKIHLITVFFSVNPKKQVQTSNLADIVLKCLNIYGNKCLCYSSSICYSSRWWIQRTRIQNTSRT